MRDPSSDPHYLHATRSLQPLVSPPVDHPRALAWVPGRDVLLVGARDGGIHEVEPSFGTRLLFSTAPDPAQLAVGRGHLAVLTREGLLQVWTLDGALRWERPTELLAGLQVAWCRGGIAVAGDDDKQERRVLVFDGAGERRARARVPQRTAIGVDADGGLQLARSGEAGLTIRPFGQPFPPETSTVHQLRWASDHAVLGVANGGVTVWHGPGAAPVTVKLYDVVNAALSPDASLVGLGTRTGGVALGTAHPGPGARANPSRTEGHEGAVIAIAFSPRGRWLATAASKCWIWSY